MKRLLILFILLIPNICYSDTDGAKMSGIRFGDWYFFKDSDKSCYIYTEAKRFKGEVDDVEEAYLYVKGMAKDQYSIGVDPGVDMEVHGPLRIKIDNRERYLDIEKGRNGSTYSSLQDTVLINEMIMSTSYLKVYAMNYDNQSIVEYYSLKGFNAAMKRLAGCYKSHPIVHSKHGVSKKQKVNKIHKEMQQNTSLNSLG
ncbi:MAG: hypothetical protein ACK5WS_03835 [Alphaproteobacteria bacterium]|jgi:hypothetical protein